MAQKVFEDWFQRHAEDFQIYLTEYQKTMNGSPAILELNSVNCDKPFRLLCKEDSKFVFVTEVVYVDKSTIKSWINAVNSLLQRNGGRMELAKILDQICAFQSGVEVETPFDRPSTTNHSGNASKRPVNCDSDDDNDEGCHFEKSDVISNDIFTKEDEKKQFNKAFDAPLSSSANCAQVSSKTVEEDAKNCVICMDELENGQETVALPKCNHHFHKTCIDQCFKRNPQCPCCKTFYGAPKGTQPMNGRMSHSIHSGSVPGFKCKSYIQIQYSFPNGIQGPEHPNPGKKYFGTTRTAYLPNTTDGQRILRLLKAAFDHHLVFTVGTSATTGAENQVIWNGVHHKTNLHGGPTNYGYPDDNYLFRVEEELAAVGITVDMLKTCTVI